MQTLKTKKGIQNRIPSSIWNFVPAALSSKTFTRALLSLTVGFARASAREDFAGPSAAFRAEVRSVGDEDYSSAFVAMTFLPR